MPINKSAGFGRLPPEPARKQSLLPGAINSLAHIKSSIDKVATVIGKAPKTGGIPSPNAFLVLARLNAVRVALCGPARNANGELAREGKAAATQRLHQVLMRKNNQLAAEFQSQFRPVAGNFQQERRKRLAELAAVESLVTAIVT